MVIKLRIACAAAALLIIPGCTDLTEFDYSLQAGINILSTPDLSVVHTIENISGARSLCFLPGCVIVATTEGTLLRFDLVSYQQTGVFSIGSPSSAGYFEIEYSPTENSIYIIGGLGQIIELSVPDLEFIDDFIICQTPVDIEIPTNIENPNFYLAGATSRRIFEVRKGTNNLSRVCDLYVSPTCMAIDHAQDTILVGTLGTTALVSIGGTTMKRRVMNSFPGILAIEAIPNDTTLCAVFDNFSTEIATILNYLSSSVVPVPLWTGEVIIDGDTHYMCVESEGSHVYVLSYLGDGTSRLVSYNCSGYFIESQVDLQGYPLDIAISPGGTLLVLTAE